MNITLNKQMVEVDDNSTIYDILNQRGMIKPGIAVAVDNKVVPRDAWQQFVLPDDAKVTVISAVCGG